MSTVRDQLIENINNPKNPGTTIKYLEDSGTGMVFQVFRLGRKHHKIYVPLYEDLNTSVLNCKHYDYV